MKVRIAIICIFVIGLNINLQAQNLPHLDGVEVEASVTQDSIKSFFLFKYFIFNPTESKGNLTNLGIDITLTSSVISIDTTGLIFKNSYLEGAFRRIYSGLKGRIVPVGFPNMPEGWDGNLSHSKRAVFNSFPGIPPGDSLSGFQMMSRGLPSIRKVIAEPTLDLSKHFNSLDDPVDPASPSEIDSVRKSLNDTSFTIGPSLPPDPFDAASFTGSLRSCTGRACELQWITNKGVCNSLEKKLKNVKTQIERGNAKTAVNVLQAFINEVEAQKGKKLTSEGYGLLYFNAVYLREQLEESK